MGYLLYERGIKPLDSTFHRGVVSRTGRSTKCLRGRGITAVIKTKFFPDYVFRGAANGLGKTHNKKRGKGAGMARGRQVDTEIQHWMARGFAKQGDKGRAPPLHPFSRAFIALVTRLRLTPVATQVVCRDESCNIATLVDAVFLNAQGRIVVVELKTGFEGYNDASNGRMRGEFRHLTNAPANQHKVQLAFTQIMFERTFPEFKQVDALLIRITSGGAHVRSLGRRELAAARAATRQAGRF
jgi:hypothetical protein